jgi:adenosylcobinamide-GDP ribazoletransferase
VSDARRALAFLTPLGGAALPSPGALAWFPVVGAALGGALGVTWWGLSRFWPPAVVAAVVVGLDLGLTGLLHIDGLVDSADGLLPHLSRERRLEVMRQPTVGAFGVAVCAAVLLGRWAALFAARPSILLLVSLWIGSRTTMAIVATSVPYAREGEEGLARAFLGSRRAGVLAAAVGVPCAFVAAVAAVRGSPEAGPVALVSGAVAAGLVVWLAVRRIGGFTGDVLGASGLVLETVGLLVASARW